MFKSLWLRLQEPRAVTVAQTLVYAVATFAGVMSLIAPPTSFEGYLGISVPYVWGGFAILGGLAGMYSAPTGKWLIEKPAVIACLTATSLYAGSVLTLHITTNGNRLVQLSFVIIALLHFVTRYFRIRPFSYEPGK